MYNPFQQQNTEKIHFPDFSEAFLDQNGRSPYHDAASNNSDSSTLNIEESQIFHDMSFNIDLKLKSNEKVSEHQMQEYFALREQERQEESRKRRQDASDRRRRSLSPSRAYFSTVGDHLPTYEIQRNIRRRLRMKYQQQEEFERQQKRQRRDEQSPVAAKQRKGHPESNPPTRTSSSGMHARTPSPKTLHPDPSMQTTSVQQTPSSQRFTSPLHETSSPRGPHGENQHHYAAAARYYNSFAAAGDKFDPNLLLSPPSRIVLYEPSNDRPTAMDEDGKFVSRSMQTNLTIAPLMTVKITVVDAATEAEMAAAHLQPERHQSNTFSHSQQYRGGVASPGFTPQHHATPHSHDTFNSPSFIEGGGHTAHRMEDSLQQEPLSPHSPQGVSPAQLHVSPPSGLFFSPQPTHHLKPPTGKSPHVPVVQSPFLSPIQASRRANTPHNRSNGRQRNQASTNFSSIEDVTPIKSTSSSASHAQHISSINGHVNSHEAGQSLFFSPPNGKQHAASQRQQRRTPGTPRSSSKNYSTQQNMQRRMQSPSTPSTNKHQRMDDSSMIDVQMPFLSPIAPIVSKRRGHAHQRTEHDNRDNTSYHNMSSDAMEDSIQQQLPDYVPNATRDSHRQHDSYQQSPAHMDMSGYQEHEGPSFLSPVKTHFSNLPRRNEDESPSPQSAGSNPQGAVLFAPHQNDSITHTHQSYHDDDEDEEMLSHHDASAMSQRTARAVSPSFLSPVRASPLDTRKRNRPHYEVEERQEFVTPRSRTRKQQAVNHDDHCRELDFNREDDQGNYKESTSGASYHMSSDSIFKQQRNHHGQTHFEDHRLPHTGSVPTSANQSPSFISPVKMDMNSSMNAEWRRMPPGNNHKEAAPAGRHKSQHRQYPSSPLSPSHERLHEDMGPTAHCPKCGFSSSGSDSIARKISEYSFQQQHHQKNAHSTAAAGDSPRNSRPHSGRSSMRFHPYAESTSPSTLSLPISRANTSALYAMSNPVRSPLSPLNYSYIKSKILSPSLR